MDAKTLLLFTDASGKQTLLCHACALARRRAGDYLLFLRHVAAKDNKCADCEKAE